MQFNILALFVAVSAALLVSAAPIPQGSLGTTSAADSEPSAAHCQSCPPNW
jgi:hypothetical protein